MNKQEHNETCANIAQGIDEICYGVIVKCPYCGEFLHVPNEPEDESGAFVCESCGEWLQDSDWTEENYAETVTLYDYFSDVYDIEYILDSNREIIGARFLVAYGGPNIWVDSRRGVVSLNWWNESGEAYMSGAVCDALNNFADELFNC